MNPARTASIRRGPRRKKLCIAFEPMGRAGAEKIASRGEPFRQTRVVLSECGRLPSAARRRSTPLPPQSSPPFFFSLHLLSVCTARRVPDLRRDGERAQPRGVIEDVAADDHLIRLGLSQEGLQSRRDRSRRADERAGQRLPQLRLFRRRGEAVDIVGRRRQLTRLAAAQVDEALLQRGEEPRALPRRCPRRSHSTPTMAYGRSSCSDGSKRLR